MEKIKCSNLFVKIGLNVHICQKKKRHGIDYLGQSVTGVESTCMYEINFTYNYVSV